MLCRLPSWPRQSFLFLLLIVFLFLFFFLHSHVYSSTPGYASCRPPTRPSQEEQANVQAREAQASARASARGGSLRTTPTPAAHTPPLPLSRLSS